MGSSKTPEAPKVDIAKDIRQYVSGMQKALPSVLELEGQYRPQFSSLNLQDVGNFLQGQNGIQGLIGQAGAAGLAGVQQTGDARSAALTQMQGQAPQTRSFLQSLAPESAAMVGNATDAANRAYQSAQGLSPQEERSAQQFAREAYGARGRLNDNASIAGELLNREGVLAGKRQEAAQFGSQAYEMSQGFYSGPGMSILNNAPVGYQAGQQLLGYGLSSIGASSPQMLDIGAAVNIGAANRQNQFNASAAAAGQPSPWASAAGGAAAGAAYGSSLGPYGAVIGGVLGGASGYFASDKRVKKDIKKVGKTDGGLPVYTYKYKGSDTTQMGVMAQEVQKKHPEAVGYIGGGILGVDYNQIK